MGLQIVELYWYIYGLTNQDIGLRTFWLDQRAYGLNKLDSGPTKNWIDLA